MLKTVTALREEGFSGKFSDIHELTADISTQEVLTRTYDLMMPPPAGSHHLKSVSSITQRLRTHEKRKEERRVIQMRNAREKVRLAKEAAEAEEAAAAEGMEVDAAETSEKRKQPDPEEPEAKRARTVEPEVAAEEAPEDEAEALYDEPAVAWPSMVLTKPSPEMRGHTSYLTFATLYPASIRAQITALVQEGTTALPTRAGSPAAVAE